MKKIFLILTTLMSHFLYGQKFELLKKENTGIDFVNVIIEDANLNNTIYEYIFNGGGVALGDINNDGLTDIYFSGNMYGNKLFLNLGNLKFKDITASAQVAAIGSWNTGVNMVDINHDGWLDIYVCNGGPIAAANRRNILYINNKNNTFTNQAVAYGLADSSYSTQSYFHDMDLDGDLDLFLLNHPIAIKEAKKINLQYNTKGVLEAVLPSERTNVSYRYYENNNGKFTDKTLSAGLGTHAFGLSAIVDDFNNDGYPDIYSCNDYTMPDNLFINNKNGTFTDKIDDYVQHMSYNCMGSDFADLNNDGYSDLITLDMMPEKNYRQKTLKQQMSYDQFNKLEVYGFKKQFVKNIVQLNNKGKSFSDVSYYTGMEFTDWSWAPLIADFDNDGHKDVYITNGYYRDLVDMDYMNFKADSINKALANHKSTDDLNALFSAIPSVPVSNYYFHNDKNMKFSNQTTQAGVDIPSFSNGAAYADLDNDGDLDIVVNNINMDAFILQNLTTQTSKNNAIQFVIKSSTKDNGYGTKIEITTPDKNKQYQTFYPSKGFLSSHQPYVHFGISDATTCSAKITFKNGKIIQLDNLAANKVHIVDENKAIDIPNNSTKQIDFFKDITKVSNLNWKHKENDYIDFKMEPLLPKKYSTQGPALVVGDVNGDGIEDIFVGGASGQDSKIFIQNTNGKFSELKNDIFISDKKYEDVNAKLFDADKDGDLDLIVVSGGNEFPKNKEQYPVRLYLNNGKGIFQKANNFPKILVSGKAIAIGDYDKDNDQDIFIGGKIVPGSYGTNPTSYLLKNTNGLFTIANIPLSLSEVGMVSAAEFVDLENDGYLDLVVNGEWMPIKFFRNNQGQYVEQPEILNDTDGWWYSLQKFDINQDGKMDLLFGNVGMNTRYKATKAQPMAMLVNDFDKNGSTDCILNFFEDGVSYPIATRDNLLDQMAFLRKKYTRYHQYAKARTGDVFTEEQIKTSQISYIKSNKSLLGINNGKTNYAFKPLPMEAQLFPIQSANLFKSGNKNYVLLLGNDFGLDIESGHNDAGNGLLYEVDNEGNFTTLEIGLKLDGDIRNAQPIIINQKQAFIISRNNAAIQIISEY